MKLCHKCKCVVCEVEYDTHVKNCYEVKVNGLKEIKKQIELKNSYVSGQYGIKHTQNQ